MKMNEPTLGQIADYADNESTQKRLTVWIVILSGLLIGAIYGMLGANSSVDDTVSVKTGIIKY